jgi:teichuronic acid biosynthesis glycosyltransferase TuaC
LSERIAVISTSYPRAPGDAAGHFVASEVKRFVRAGHEVHVFAPGAAAQLMADNGARVHWLADHGAFGFPGALARLREKPTRVIGASAFAVGAMRALREASPFTRVQAHFLVPCAWPIAVFGAQRGAALELVGHGSDVRLFCRLPASVRRQIAKAWVARRARVRVTSSELAELLRATVPELGGAIVVEPCPVDVEGVVDREGARARLGFSPTAGIAVIVSRLISGKRVDVALRALTLLEGISVIVIGDGPELASLRAAFPSVRFTGHLPRPDALTYVAAADVLVSASKLEGAPSVVREARALGVPVVAVSAGDLSAWAQADSELLVVRA